jgi:hypothetical protein
MGAVTLAVIGLVIVSGSIGEEDHRRTAGTVRLRPLQSMGHRLVSDGLKQSGTLRRLVEELDRSDVIVYLELRGDMPSKIAGSLRFVAPSASDRFLRISLNRRHEWSTLIAMLGHELQHATEVAAAREVRSADGLRAFYQRVGIRVGENAYDSSAAQEMGRIVRAELRGAPRLLPGRRASLDEILLGSGSIEAAAQ